MSGMQYFSNPTHDHNRVSLRHLQGYFEFTTGQLQGSAMRLGWLKNKWAVLNFQEKKEKNPGIEKWPRSRSRRIADPCSKTRRHGWRCKVDLRIVIVYIIR